MTEKTKGINRLLLIVIIWAVAASFFSGWLFQGLSETQTMAAGQLLYFVPVLAYVIAKRIKPQRWIPFRRISVAAVLLSALTALLLLPLTTFLNLLSMLFATNFVSQTGSQLQTNPFWLNLLVIAVMPAILEELAFRGIFYHAYREKGVIIGAAASGIAFGLLHLNINQFCYALVLGMFFCILMEVTGSIFASMTAHFVINGWNVMLMALQRPLQEAVGTAEVPAAIGRSEMLMAISVYGVLAMIGTTLAIAVMIWMARLCGREAHLKWCFRKPALPAGMKRHFITPSFAAAFAIALFMMILLEVVQRI